MTLRAVAIGLLLAIFISIATYFNDWIIGQTMLIGSHLPTSVFGIAVLLLFCINPLLGLLNAKLPFKPAELVVVVTLGIAACGLPGSSFFRLFTAATAYPTHLLKTRANWQAVHVMSYVPGASGELAEGQIQDFKALAEKLTTAGARAPSTPAGRLYSHLSPAAQRSLAEGLARGFDAGRESDLTAAIDAALARPDLFDGRATGAQGLTEQARALVSAPPETLAPHDVVRRNRWLLVAALPGIVLPPPEGQGVVFDQGRADSFALDTLVQGRSRDHQLGIRDLPWHKWWPTIRLWWGAALLLSLVALCAALIIHPQWSKRELLPYPVARFVEEASARAAGARLPDVAKNKLFWIGFASMAAWHLVNGLHAWFPALPEIPRKFDLWSLQQVFPNAIRASTSYGFFGPTIFASVVAFSFFLSSSVSFSLGAAGILYMALVAMMLGYGVQIEGGAPDGNGPMFMRFGSYAAVALMIVYTGRRYYASVAKSALGRPRSAETPAYAPWAARIGALAVAVTIAVLRSAGIGWGFAALFVAFELIIFVVMSRMIAETGTFFMQHAFTPVGILTGMLGFGAIGPTAYVVLAFASAILFGDTRELLMPYLVNGFKLVDRDDGPTPARVAPWMFGVVLGSLVLAGTATLYLQYNHGSTQVGNDWATASLAPSAFDALTRRVSAAAADGTLAEATAVRGLSRLSAIHPDSRAMTFLLVGLGLGFGAAVARLRFPWWPLHPVAFLVWNTYPNAMFGPSFLLGWMIKSAVVGAAGARGYHQVKPLMVGVIAGELLSGLFWMLVATAYYFSTGKAPTSYAVFPL